MLKYPVLFARTSPARRSTAACPDREATYERADAVSAEGVAQWAAELPDVLATVLLSREGL